MRLPDVLGVHTPGAAVIDPDTGNARPGPSSLQAVRGVVQQRFIDTQQREVSVDGTVAEMVAMLEPVAVDGTPTVLTLATSTITDPAGLSYEVVGLPRPRRPVTGARRVAYVAAYVRLSTDTQEAP